MFHQNNELIFLANFPDWESYQTTRKNTFSFEETQEYNLPLYICRKKEKEIGSRQNFILGDE